MVVAKKRSKELQKKKEREFYKEKLGENPLA